jgi:tRNA (guanine-N7-)-methyltransferase
MERCSNLLAAEPEALRGRWLSKYPYKSLYVELGCGKGLFTVETALAEPDAFIVALEKTADAMVVALERATDAWLLNARFINGYANDITKYFAEGEVSRIYINFCDPWPRARHAKRRLTSKGFIDLYSQVLRPGGEVRFKTDDAPLLEFSLKEFERAGYEVVEATRDLHANGVVGVMTDFETKFNAEGKAICSARFVNQK